MKLVNTVIIIFDFPAGRFFGAKFAKNSNICKQILENLMFVKQSANRNYSKENA